MQWLIEDQLENAHIGYRAIVDEEGCTVCNPSPMGEANARIIAAAPDLLAACIEAMALFDNYPEIWECIGTHEVMTAAIAKATGDQTA
jgi:hypothetical protein